MSDLGNSSTEPAQDVCQQLQAMSINEFKALLNAATPHGKRTTEQAKMFEQLVGTAEQPEEPPPLKNSSKYSSSLQSLNKSQGGAASSNSKSEKSSVHKKGQPNDNNNVVPALTTNCSNSICNSSDSFSAPGCNTSSVSDARGQTRDLSTKSSRSNQNSHARYSVFNSNSSNYQNSSEATIFSDSAYHILRKADTEASRNDTQYFGYNKSVVDGAEAPKFSGNANLNTSTSSAETILGLPSAYSPLLSPSPSPSHPSYYGSTEETTIQKLSNVKALSQTACDESNYALPYYFNGREEGDDGGDSEGFDDPVPSTSSAAYGGSSNYATVSEFIGHNPKSPYIQSIPYPYIINRGIQNSLYRNPHQVNDFGGADRQGLSSSHLSKSASYRDLNTTFDTGRALTPTQYSRTLDPAGSSGPTTIRRFGDREVKRNRKDKSLKGVTTSDQIQGFRGGEDVDQLVKFIEGEAASENKKAKVVKKEKDSNRKGKRKDILVKSVSLDDDNLPTTNSKPILERSSSSNSLENKGTEDRDSDSTDKMEATTTISSDNQRPSEELGSVISPDYKKSPGEDLSTASSLDSKKTTEERQSTASSSGSKKSPEEQISFTKTDKEKNQVERKNTEDIIVNSTKPTEDYIVVSRKKRKKPETNEQPPQKEREPSVERVLERNRNRPNRATYTGPRTYARSVGSAEKGEVARPVVQSKPSQVEPAPAKPSKEPVIFCGQNFKEQPKVLTPDIEFGFGVNDFIDSAKNKDSIIASCKEPKIEVSQSTQEKVTPREDTELPAEGTVVAIEKSNAGSDHHHALPDIASPGTPIPMNLPVSPSQIPPASQIQTAAHMLTTQMPRSAQISSSVHMYNTPQMQTSMQVQVPSSVQLHGAWQMPNMAQNYQIHNMSAFSNMGSIPVPPIMQSTPYAGYNCFANQQPVVITQDMATRYDQYLRQVINSTHQETFLRPQYVQTQLNVGDNKAAYYVNLVKSQVSHATAFPAGRGAVTTVPAASAYHTYMNPSFNTNPQQTYSNPQQTYPNPQQTYSNPQQTYSTSYKPDRSSGVDREHRGGSRGGGNRRGTRTYYNATHTLSQERRGAHSSYGPRDGLSYSRRGSHQSNSSPMSPPMADVSPAETSNESRSMSTSSSQQDLNTTGKPETESRVTKKEEETAKEVLDTFQRTDLEDPDLFNNVAQASDLHSTYEQKLLDKKKRGVIKVYNINDDEITET